MHLGELRERRDLPRACVARASFTRARAAPPAAHPCAPSTTFRFFLGSSFAGRPDVAAPVSRLAMPSIKAHRPGAALQVGVYAATVAAETSSPARVVAPRPSAVFLSGFALAMALVAAAFIDAEHMYLPDPITLGGTLFGLATPGPPRAWLGSTRPNWSAAIAVSSCVWLPFIVGYKGGSAAGPGMGLGDAKLVMLAGAWFGWPAVPFALFAGATQATLAAGAAAVSHAADDRRARERCGWGREELQARGRAGRRGSARTRAPRGTRSRRPQARASSRRASPSGPFLCLAVDRVDARRGKRWLTLLPALHRHVVSHTRDPM